MTNNTLSAILGIAAAIALVLYFVRRNSRSNYKR
jgi:LPXTG-motif cell wall-anchored protein